VIVDAVFDRPADRADVEALARELGVALQGLWLSAPPQALASRVTARRGDASDATAEVVAQQLSLDTGSIGWQQIDAGGEMAATLQAARRVLNTIPDSLRGAQASGMTGGG
jgi:predicted kinase